MAPRKPYMCICLNRQFETPKALTLHENVCPVVAEREQVRYAPYRQKPRTQASLDEPSIIELEIENNKDAGKDAIPTMDLSDQADEPATESSTAVLENSPRAASPVPPTSDNTYPATRSRTWRLFQGYRDNFDALPEGPPPIPHDSAPIPSSSSHPAHTCTQFVPFETPVDSFGRFRIYPSKPVKIPDSNATLEDYVDHNFAPKPQTEPSAGTSVHNAIAPCPNLSTFYFLRWFWKGSNKSVASHEELRDVLLRPNFNPADLAGVNLTAIDKKLAETPYAPQEHGGFDQADGWVKRSVPVQVPLRQKGPHGGSQSGHQILVPGLRLRSILNGICKQFSRNDPTHVHFEPFKSLWVPPGKSKSEAQTLMGEIYNSPEMIEEYKEIQKLKISDAKCMLPRVPAAVMFGSDALQLGAFSTKKAWMLYMWLGNISKYKRCKPNSGYCYDLAHIPSLPDSVKDEITKLNGRPPSASLLTHLRRELMHAVLHDILDAEFVQAWKHGIVIKCADGITRRVFPRIFTYSADYPER
ncbi:hypothetical protein FRC07_001441 [Ceratobasidium sp. 392]|nr:hypothetical protein FRC07_001441 [Ceratobasidium sp. 392]